MQNAPSTFALSVIVIAIAGCAHGGSASSSLPVLAHAGPPAGNTTTYKVLYSFKGRNDSAHPEAELIVFHGKLYGTSYDGGGSGCVEHAGCGTVFEVSPSGQERVVYAFKGIGDGAHPSAALIEMNGRLYGTTRAGGGSGCTAGCGTVFTVTLSGRERTVYSFHGGMDGSSPAAGLLAVDGALYGTTEYGGNAACSQGCGTVFDVMPFAGKETIVYGFQGGSDGYHPTAALIAVNGEFYGTTESGGFVSSGSDYGCVYYSPGCGTIFKVSPAGKERIVYTFDWSFDNPSGGATPTASLIYTNRKFYGTTILGGTNGNATMFGPGCGTVFAMAASGELKYIHIFQKVNSYYCKAATPSGLTLDNGSLYGTTQHPGTIFMLGLSGGIAYLHEFTGGIDGDLPLAGVVAGPNGLLYGTTYQGGTACREKVGCGTVFEVLP